MQYMLLIYRNDKEFAAWPDAKKTEMYKAFGGFTQGIVKSGNFKAGDPLQPVSTATTVRVREGKTLTTDGPFAETREQLSGYYIIDAKNLDEAISIAAKVPIAPIGSVEVRPIMAMG
jgi:hypothetical protein